MRSLREEALVVALAILHKVTHTALQAAVGAVIPKLC